MASPSACSHGTSAAKLLAASADSAQTTPTATIARWRPPCAEGTNFAR
ncbi:hypothetical protein ACFPES_27390 [Paenibacillus sp. GCM10023248]